MPVSTTDANGIVTKYAYNEAGLVTRRKRLDGSETLTSLGVAYDAVGRLVREGSKTYRYGYLDKVMSVTDGDTTRTFTYHADGQLASANYGDSSESFAWDGLALIQRGDEQFINEPHVGGGNPVASSKGTSYFNDALGTTVGSKQGGKYSAAALTAFGEDLTVHFPTPTQNSNFFTGKPYVEGLGHAFWMRNYRAGLAKWQTADPLGYPDGWNALAYCNNGVTSAVDLWGCARECVFPGVVDDLNHEVTVNPILEGVLYNGMVYSLAIWWTCNHDFENTNISSRIKPADGCSDTVYYYSQNGKDVYIGFSYEITENSCVLMEKMSTSFQKVYLLTIRGKFYATIITCVEDDSHYGEPMFIGDLDVSYTHSVAREIFE